MGYSDDIMYDMAMKDIKTVFPEYDGWQRQQLVTGNKNEKVYSFSRRLQGNVECGIAWVSFSPEIASEIALPDFQISVKRSLNVLKKFSSSPFNPGSSPPPGNRNKRDEGVRARKWPGSLAYKEEECNELCSQTRY